MTMHDEVQQVVLFEVQIFELLHNQLNDLLRVFTEFFQRLALYKVICLNKCSEVYFPHKIMTIIGSDWPTKKCKI